MKARRRINRLLWLALAILLAINWAIADDCELPDGTLKKECVA